MFSHPSFSMPGNCMSASLSHVGQSFVPVYSICGSCTNYTLLGWLTLTLGALPLFCGQETWLRADCAVVLCNSNPTDTLWKQFKCCKTETRLWLGPNKFITFMYTVIFFINSRVTSAENQGPHNILDHCLKVMGIWSSLPDTFIILCNACWAHPMLFIRTI